MNGMKVFPIGRIESEGDETRIVLDEAWRSGLKGLESYGHVQVLYWLDGCDTPEGRGKTVEKKPYARGPEALGVFATRSPERPNPIALSTAEVISVDERAGVIELTWLDALPGSAVLDVKPYIPGVDRVERALTPAWCAHWPQSLEASGGFDWDAEFAFR
ncbi:MAG: SAM-dependent methyltransferase [Eubacteriales bacterium]|nr:SAM-dependent methyltransferase [Eubacteriales bacterium]